MSLAILRKARKHIEICGRRFHAEVRLVRLDRDLVILIEPEKVGPIRAIPVAPDLMHAHRQYLLLTALPVMTHTLVCSAMVMAYPWPEGARIPDPALDLDAVRVAIGEAAVRNILEMPLPEDLVASPS